MDLIFQIDIIFLSSTRVVEEFNINAVENGNRGDGVYGALSRSIFEESSSMFSTSRSRGQLN